MSLVCQTEAFARFACAVIIRLATFYKIHNQIVRDYRSAHGIRSRLHPVPDLAIVGAWREAPFWAWRRGQTRREKLFVRRQRGAWTLKIGNIEGPTLPNHPAGRVDAWRALETQGIKIRSRALTTTMFARLFLADVFIHGIGGGIYDELTDGIIERFFNVAAPGFLTVSATLLLPLPRYPDAVAEARKLARHERDLIYKPERFVESTAELGRLIAAKQEWIRRDGATHAERVERFEKIRAINACLLPHVQPPLQQVLTELAERRQQVAWNAVNARRDYAFCLYPEDMLKTYFAKAIQ